jgi:hypothetical protein
MTTTKTTSLNEKDLKRKLNNALRRESTVYFKIEELRKKGKCNNALETKAKELSEEISHLYNEIKTLKNNGDMV